MFRFSKLFFPKVEKPVELPKGYFNPPAMLNPDKAHSVTLFLHGDQKIVDKSTSTIDGQSSTAHLTLNDYQGGNYFDVTFSTNREGKFSSNVGINSNGKYIGNYSEFNTGEHNFFSSSKLHVTGVVEPQPELVYQVALSDKRGRRKWVKHPDCLSSENSECVFSLRKGYEVAVEQNGFNFILRLLKDEKLVDSYKLNRRDLSQLRNSGIIIDFEKSWDVEVEITRNISRSQPTFFGNVNAQVMTYYHDDFQVSKYEERMRRLRDKFKGL